MKPTINPSNMSHSNGTLQDMLKRQDELQYAAMAHALSGQQLPDDLASEYATLEKSIKQLNAERLLNRMNEMQYAAMAHAQTGQPLSEEFAREYADLERQVAQL
jgi:transcriptional regulator of met regulon